MMAKKLKTAKVQIEAVTVTCPHCGELLTSDHGSQLIELVEYTENVFTCKSCQESFKLPDKIWRN